MVVYNRNDMNVTPLKYCKNRILIILNFKNYDLCAGIQSSIISIIVTLSSSELTKRQKEQKTIYIYNVHRENRKETARLLCTNFCKNNNSLPQHFTFLHSIWTSSLLLHVIRSRHLLEARLPSPRFIRNLGPKQDITI